MIELNVLTDSLIPLEVMGGGSGGITPTGTKQISITQNGTTTENVYSYADAEITVNVPQSSGTKSVSITSNGTTTEDVTSYASASINVNVPNSYSASDEGKVVSNGALVSQTSATYTTNDTYDTTLINEVTVNVSGGGSISVDDIAQNLQPSGDIALSNSVTSIGDGAFYRKPITSINGNGVTSIGAYAFYGCSNLADIDFPNVSSIKNYTFSECTNLADVILPSVTSLNYVTYAFYNGGTGACVMPLVSTTNGAQTFRGAHFTKVDFRDIASIPNNFFNSALVNVLILRNTDSITSLANTGTFTSTPFASNGTGGTLYVPQALISSYQSATNWSTILGYANNQIKSIESTHTDPNAPIDLTLYYADGTPIT